MNFKIVKSKNIKYDGRPIGELIMLLRGSITNLNDNLRRSDITKALEYKKEFDIWKSMFIDAYNKNKLDDITWLRIGIKSLQDAEIIIKKFHLYMRAEWKIINSIKDM